MKRLGVYYIATSNYKMGFEHFKKNLSYFYPHYKKSVVIISDGLEKWNGVEENGIDYTVHKIQHFPWPIITLFKMKYILDFWHDDFDYVCYFNGNLQCNKDFDWDNELIDLELLNVSRHCMWDGITEYDGIPSTNDGCASITHPYWYIHAGLFIGKSSVVKKMCVDVSKMVESDLINNIIPSFHDESYLNRWCEDNPHLVKKSRLIKYEEFNKDYPFSIIETIDKDRRTNIRYEEDSDIVLIDSNEGRFANQLFPIFKALSENKDKKIYFKNYWEYKDQRRISDSIINRLPKKLRDVVCFDNDEYDRIVALNKPCRYIKGYCQDVTHIDFETVREFFGCTESIKKEIESLYGDVSKFVCLHVRRGDYLNYSYKYPVLTKEYIVRCLNKHFPNTKIICISDDMKWCKRNLSDLDIIFADKHKDVLLDFYIQTLTIGNICSASSFSIAGSIINPYRKMIIPYPFFKCNVEDINLYTSWAIKENL